MGVYRCSVPHCETKYGKGIPISRVPSDPLLLARWMAKLPRNFVCASNSGVCELHFPPEAFEKLRADGKRKLKRSAVPTIFASHEQSTKRMPLGTNKNIVNIPCQQPSLGHDRAPNPLREHSYAKPKLNEVPFKSYNFQGDLIPLALLVPLEEPEKENCQPQASELEKLMKIIEEQRLKIESLQKQREAKDEVVLVDQEQTMGDLKKCSEKNTVLGVDKEEIFEHEESIETIVSVIKEQEGRLGALVKSSDEKDMAIIMDQATQIEALKSAGSEKEKIVLHSDSNYIAILEKELKARDSIILEFKESEAKAYAELSKSRKLKAKVSSENFILKRKCKTLQKAKSRVAAQNNLYNSMKEKFWPDQINALRRKSTRGMTWSPQSIREGLIMKMSCGTKGYSLLVKRFPLWPSVRCLQRAVQFIKFECGIIQEVFDLLEGLGASMRPEEKDCCIVLDEMCIEEDERIDPSTGQWVGKATFPTHTGIANKALVIMLCGITTRWKHSVAFYLTSKRDEDTKKDVKNNPFGHAMKKILDDIMCRAEKIGFLVHSVTSDIGPDNEATWRAYGVNGGKKGPVVSSVPHPGNPNRKVSFLPDAIHLFKSIKTMMDSNKFIRIPDEIVKSEGLHSPFVDYSHIEDLYQYESGFELKLPSV